VVRRFDGEFKDTHNFLTTASSIQGEWSDPVFLNSGGFDPSLFHAEDGRKWLLNMLWDHRPGRSHFRGIALQEYSPQQQALLGERCIIFEGTELDYVEGPHLYQVGDWYHLATAEGGTGYTHAVTMARSRQLEGPYQADPQGPLLYAADAPEARLQRTGHGDLVQTADGRWYLVHLASRPLAGLRRSPLGRESCIQEVVQDEDGWFRLRHGGRLAADTIEAPDLARFGVDPPLDCDEFDHHVLNPVYQWLRRPHPERFCDLQARPGFLRLTGGESLGSLYDQSLLARRQVDFCFTALTTLEFEPVHFQHMAGLVLYYNASKFHYLYLSHDAELGKHLAVMSGTGEVSTRAEFPGYAQRVPLPGQQPVHLRAEVEQAQLRFAWSLDGEEWHVLPLDLDASLLSDEAGKGEGAQFTGNFIGLCCQDLDGHGIHADFDRFHYLGKD
jgi:xylan 1,4-beta-xylosidase